MACLIFIAVKLAMLDYRFGDGNAYLYDAYLLTQGALPYRDFLHADFPVQIGILALLRPFFANWVMGYHLVPVVAEAITAYLLFLILKRRGNTFAWLAPVAHLWTFTVLSTSDFITGVQITTLFTVFGWYLYDLGYTKITGVVFALSFLTKMYTLPAAAVFGILDLWHRRFRRALQLLAGTLTTVAVVVIPLLVVTYEPMLEQTFWLHFKRPAGLDKQEILRFFLVKEWALVTLAIPGLWMARKEAQAWSFVVTALFFLFFRDLYFVYLDFFMPFLVIFSLSALDFLWHKKGNFRLIAAGGIATLAIGNVVSDYSYFNYFQKLGHFSNAQDVASAVKELPDKFDLYGSHEVTPLVALLSGRSIFHNHADTNTQAFAAGTLDRAQLSEAAVRAGIYLIARITHLPEQGYIDVGYQGYFSPERMQDSCQRVLTFPSTSNEIDNQIVVYRCKNQG
jgi:hypothetical protein